MSVRLKIENSREGLVATISQRDDAGKVIGRPSVSLSGDGILLHYKKGGARFPCSAEL